MPGAHAEGALLDLEARIHGFRLIVPDRPGIGLTPFRPIDALTDLIAGYCDLLDHLGIAACHQVGWSSGGPVALAMAARAPERVRGATVMAGYTHFQEVPDLDQLLPSTNRRIRFMSGEIPGAVGILVRLVCWTERLLPWLYFRTLEALCVGADRKVLGQPQVRRTFMKAQRQTFRQGMAGPRQDLALQYRDWGFRLAEVAAPVTIYHGSEDPFVVPVNAEDLTRRLPDCQLRRLPGAGHLFPLSRGFQSGWFRELRTLLEKRQTDLE